MGAEAAAVGQLQGVEVAAYRKILFAVGRAQGKACYSVAVRGAAVAAAAEGVRVVDLHTSRTLRSSSLLARESQAKASAARQAHKLPGSY